MLTCVIVSLCRGQYIWFQCTNIWFCVGGYSSISYHFFSSTHISECSPFWLSQSFNHLSLYLSRSLSLSFFLIIFCHWKSPVVEFCDRFSKYLSVNGFSMDFGCEYSKQLCWPLKCHRHWNNRYITQINSLNLVHLLE